MTTARLIVSTFNIWGDDLLSDRSAALTKTILLLRPDVFLFQEMTDANMAVVKAALPEWDDLSLMPHFTLSSGCNIFWKTDIFEFLDWGFVCLDCVDYPERMLLWAALRVRNTNISVIVSTAHLPWCGAETEVRTGVNGRIEPTRKIASFLQLLSEKYEYIIFGGDLNEDFHPVSILSKSAGLVDIFQQLDLPPPITHPVRPSEFREEMRVR
jgi:hypothetical protein